MSEDSKLEIVVATKDSLPVRSETGSGLVARGLRAAKLRAELDAILAAWTVNRIATVTTADLGRAFKLHYPVYADVPDRDLGLALQSKYPGFYDHIPDGPDIDSHPDLGVPQDYKEAVRWYKLAADQGHASAQYNLGLMYATGQGVPQDYKEALRWYKLAADQGHASAQYNLGYMYDSGDGVPKDAVQAVSWYRKAAEQGLASAQSNLGVMYAEGEGVPKDAVQAVSWYRKAAEQGLARAQSNLGAMYSRGEGVPKDLVTAYMWRNLAAAQGDETGKKARDALETLMTPAQIAEAQKLSREWKPKKP